MPGCTVIAYEIALNFDLKQAAAVLSDIGQAQPGTGAAALAQDTANLNVFAAQVFQRLETQAWKLHVIIC